MLWLPSPSFKRLALVWRVIKNLNNPRTFRRHGNHLLRPPQTVNPPIVRHRHRIQRRKKKNLLVS